MEILSDMARATENEIVETLKTTPGMEDLFVDGWGICVKKTEHCRIYVKMMLGTNWRLVEVLADDGPEEFWGSRRGWCYTGPYSFASALIAAQRWSGAENTEPAGWVKAVHDGRRHGERKEGIEQE